MKKNFKTVLVNKPQRILIGNLTDETKHFLHLKDVTVCEGGMKYTLPQVSVLKSSVAKVLDCSGMEEI